MRFFLSLLFVCEFSNIYASNDSLLESLKDIHLPVVHIYTTNGDMPTYERAYAPDDGWGMGIKNATKVSGRLFMTIGDSLLYDSGDYSEDYSGMTIKIRGNSSAVAFDKKPFKIKLQKKADLLMRGDENKFKDNEWLLLKDEKSTLFKLIAFKVNQILGLQWTPEFKYVNLVINDEYWGLYELCESVKRNNSCRLNVADSGFIFEYDLFWWNEDLYVKSSLSDPWTLNYTFKYPQSKYMNDKQLSGAGGFSCVSLSCFRIKVVPLHPTWVRKRMHTYA